jgi:predicted regulator of Ras-like GTPase activity (Roadblock/LC7/MglB family)
VTPDQHASEGLPPPSAPDVDVSVRNLIDHVVDGVPGVLGAVMASADGFGVASRLPTHVPLDSAAIAAMSAAALGLATRLVGLGGTAPASISVHRSADAQVFVFSVGGAALTVIAAATADTARIERIGREVVIGLSPAFRTGA